MPEYVFQIPGRIKILGDFYKAGGLLKGSPAAFKAMFEYQRNIEQYVKSQLPDGWKIPALPATIEMKITEDYKNYPDMPKDVESSIKIASAVYGNCFMPLHHRLVFNVIEAIDGLLVYESCQIFSLKVEKWMSHKDSITLRITYQEGTKALIDPAYEELYNE